MKLITLPLAILVLASGCQSPVFRSLARIGCGAGGAAIGNMIGDGHPAGAAVGAAVGVGVTEAVTHYQTKAERQAFTQGYQKAQSDQTKREYWQRQQALRGGETGGSILFPVPEPSRVTPDGVLLLPSNGYVEIHR